MPTGTQSGQLFGRTYRLVVAPVVGTSLNDAIAQAVTDKQPPNATDIALDLSDLDFKFHVKRTLKPKPNTCKIEVYGLNKSSRLYFATPKKLAVSLEAGYNGENEQLFLGETRNSFSKQGKDGCWVTYLETGDSEKAMAAAGLTQTFSGKTISIQDAFNALQANIPTVMSKSQLATNKTLAKFGGQVYFPKGGAVGQSATRFLDNVCRAAGLTWSIQNGVLTVLEKGSAVGNEIVISSDTGMIGSPSADNDGIHTDVESLIIPGLRPGALINIKSEDINGHYAVETIKYTGDTSPGGNPWYAKMTCTKLKGTT